MCVSEGRSECERERGRKEGGRGGMRRERRRSGGGA